MAAIPTDPPILFRDQRFVVLDKPAGLPVHPGPRGGASVEDVFPTLSRRKDGPWLAHRLDADTAGCLVIALRKAALVAAQAAFAEGRAEKTYWAVVVGGPSGDSGTVDAPLARKDGRAGWRMVVDPAGQTAVTEWRVLGRAHTVTSSWSGLTRPPPTNLAAVDRGSREVVGSSPTMTTSQISWLELRPHTGRTHQIRVHCAHLGCPILGDPIYGSASEKRLHLLSQAIDLPLDPPVAATAEPPVHMRAALSACGWSIGPITRDDRKNS